ncbi:MAG: FtsX-like permease family protein [Phycisphaerae bacterium]
MYKFTLSFRYLIRRPISYFAIAAVALCVFVVFVVITVLTGLSRDFKNKVYTSTGDCVVYTKSLAGFGYYDEFLELLRKENYIEAASPVVRSYALVSVAQSGSLSVNRQSVLEIAGIEPVPFSKITAFENWLVYHKDNLANVFEPPYDPNLPGCVPGIEILFEKDKQGRYHTTAQPTKTAFEISCIPLNAKGALARTGAGELNTKTFYYSDHFEVGYSLDSRLIFLPLEDAQLLCGMATGHKRITHIHIKFKDGIGLNSGTAQVQKLWNDFAASKTGLPYHDLLEQVQVQNWKDFSRVIVALVETQQTMMIVCFCLIGIITVFIVLVVFYMLVAHKSKDIGILKSLGASGINILSVFLNFALLIGLAGSAVGALAGWPFLVYINDIFRLLHFQLWNPQLTSIGDIPNTIEPKVLAIIIISAVAASLLGALLPSWRASKIKCVDTLQVAQL